MDHENVVVVVITHAAQHWVYSVLQPNYNMALGQSSQTYNMVFCCLGAIDGFSLTIIYPNCIDNNK